EMVKKALAEEGLEGHGLRIAVHGGGCSGLQYALDFSDQSRPGDTIFEVDGLTIYVDMASMQYLTGAEIDYVSGLQGTGFKFHNPNAQRTCGCGHSFS
ncbi:MAG: iron-sulfur cluster assembly accessory protein, partial [Bdellovibrionales bacterium]|nr:iron-sulfur cluster assembly accessory protein [Bdellovibrionales bacterium]